MRRILPTEFYTCFFFQDAREVLEKIRLPEDVDAELKEIAATVAEERAALADGSGNTYSNSNVNLLAKFLF